MKKIISAIVVCLALTGCATTGPQIGDIGKVLTSTIDNPVSGVDIYRVKNTYAAALELAVEYRTYCWSKPYAVLMVDPVARPICERRRPIVRAIQAGKAKAKAAVITAENFVANNPTLNAASVIGAAWQAVTDFQSAIPATK